MCVAALRIYSRRSSVCATSAIYVRRRCYKKYSCSSKSCSPSRVTLHARPMTNILIQLLRFSIPTIYIIHMYGSRKAVLTSPISLRPPKPLNCKPYLAFAGISLAFVEVKTSAASNSLAPGSQGLGGSGFGWVQEFRVGVWLFLGDSHNSTHFFHRLRPLHFTFSGRGPRQHGQANSRSRERSWTSSRR